MVFAVGTYDGFGVAYTARRRSLATTPRQSSADRRSLCLSLIETGHPDHYRPGRFRRYTRRELATFFGVTAEAIRQWVVAARAQRQAVEEASDALP